MENLEELSHKIQRVALQLIESKKDRRQLKNEVDHLRREMRRFHSVLKENERMKKEQIQVRSRLERLDKKLAKLTTRDPVLAEADTLWGGGA